ncbi:AAA family ATPase [Dactylosporangium sp. CA-092794]|uniref:AAA family ATPase n=1 Tax=Dactylosporangium sp. CA-092794 TaxID=3239929 RepID=UPI003D90E7CD
MSTNAAPDRPLLERHDQLEALAAAATAAGAGSGRFVLVAGAAGLGKTRLLAEARRVAARAGFAVLSARGAELEREFGFGVVRQLAEPALSALDPRRRAALFAGAAAPAAAVLDTVGGAPAAGDFASLHSLYWLVANACKGRPLALFCDDLHWADEASLRFLAYLLPRLDGLRLLVAGSARPGEPDAPRKLLDLISADDACRVLPLTPLSPPAGAEVLQALLPGTAHPAFLAACHAAAGGNPLLLRELAETVQLRGIAATAGNAERIAGLRTDAVGRRVRLWLDGLPDAGVRVARAVATLGGEATLATAAELAGVGLPAALAAVADLERADILRPLPADGTPARFGDVTDLERADIPRPLPADGASARGGAGAGPEQGGALPPLPGGGASGRYEFVHPLVRTAVYEGMGLAGKADWHRRAARLLAAGGAPAERGAAHLLRIPADGDPESARTLRRAADGALGRGAPDAAVAYLERCLAEPAGREARLELLTRAGTASTLVDVGAGVAYLREALDLTAEPRPRAVIAYTLGRALSYTGRNDEALALLARAEGWVPAHDEELRRRLIATRVNMAMYFTRHGAPARAAELAALRDLPPHESAGGRMLDCVLAMHDGMAGDPGGVPRAERGIGDGLLVREALGDAALHGGWATLLAADRPGAMGLLDAAVAAAHRTGSQFALTGVLTFRGMGWYWRGQLAEAEADLRGAIRAAEVAGIGAGRPFAGPYLMLTLIEQGRLDEAAATMRWIGVPDPAPPIGPWYLYLDARAALHHARERHADAAASALAAGESFARHGFDNPAFVPWRTRAALALHLLDRSAEARELAAESLRRARRWGAPRATGHALRVLGLLTGGPEGLDRLAEAAAILAPSPARLEHATALRDLGSALRRAGRRADARTHLAEALELAQVCGATVLARSARAELRAAGARAAGRDRSGPRVLTPSEYKVAGLAALGHSNRAIAQRLFVTPKTVEVHLSSVYRKLRVTDRRAMAEIVNGWPEGGEPVPAPRPIG